jgi:malate dehydrogenase (quinone)
VVKAVVSESDVYDVVIVGAGVCGSALLYSLSNYTNVDKIALLEKNAAVALVNSKQTSNSQTLHFGDIETNYTLEKAKKVNRAALMVKNYLLRYDAAQEIYTRYHKMVLAVGEGEGAVLRDRYREFKALFPALQLIKREEIEKLEPNVLKGREGDEETLALYTPDGYTVDFQMLAESFVKNAVKDTDKQIDLRMGVRVRSIESEGGCYLVKTADGVLRAKAIAVTSGAHSLLFAKAMGYGKDYALLSAAGSFYFAPALLKGKVYRVQMEKLPFAAIHGDPEVHDASMTRFGPTAKVVPMLERHHYETVIEYFRTAGLSVAAFSSFFAILSDWTILQYIVMNFIYDIPVVGKFLFVRKVREIVPSIRYGDLTFAKGYGGLRPQIVNLQTRKMEMGQAKILGEKIIFNITPSPGASTCLKSAEEDTQQLVEFLGEGYWFDEARFAQEMADGVASL